MTSSATQLYYLFNAKLKVIKQHLATVIILEGVRGLKKIYRGLIVRGV